MLVSRNPDLSSASKKGKKCHANTFGTGIGIPGKRILVGSDVIRNAKSIEIQIDEASYSARLRPNPNSAYVSVLEYDGPDFKPVVVNPWHGYELYPFAIQRDQSARLFMRGTLPTSFNSKHGPLDEMRVQGIVKPKKGKQQVYPCSPFCRSGAIFDRTGTLYGLMNQSEIIFPSAMLQTCIGEEGLFQVLPPKERSHLTEQEMVDLVSENIVSVRAINPVAVNDDLSRGMLKTLDPEPTIECGPLKFGCSGFERLKWQPSGNVTEFEKGKGAIPFFLGRWSDLMLIDLTGQGEEAWTKDQLVRKGKSARYKAKSKDWKSDDRNVPGSLHEETRVVEYDKRVAKIERKITVSFPDTEPFNMPESWAAKPEDACRVEATQIVDFDIERGLILNSKVVGTLTHFVDEQSRTDNFEVRIKLSKSESEAPPKQLRKLTETESIVAKLGSESKHDRNSAIEALQEIQPVSNESISRALLTYNSTPRGRSSNFQQIARRWLLPQHMKSYLLREISPAKARSNDLIDILRVVEVKPAVNAAKPYVRKAILEPEKREFRIGGRALRNVYPELVDEILPLLSNVSEFKEVHGEWVRCVKAVGKSNCVPAFESYIKKVQSLGPRYHEAHGRFVMFAQQAITEAKTRPAPEIQVAASGGSSFDAMMRDAIKIQSAPRRRKSEQNLRKIVLGALEHHDYSKQQFPRNIVDENGKPLLSWRVALLPFVGEEDLYKKFKLAESWDSEHNLKLAQQLPDVYRHVDLDSNTKTVFLGFEGGGAVFEKSVEGVKAEGVGLSQIPDGSSNTIFCVEANLDLAVEWSKPTDIPFAPDMPVTQVGKNGDSSFNVVFCDGSVMALPSDFDPEAFAIMVGRNDRKIVRILK